MLVLARTEKSRPSFVSSVNKCDGHSSSSSPCLYVDSKTRTSVFFPRFRIVSPRQKTFLLESVSCCFVVVLIEQPRNRRTTTIRYILLADTFAPPIYSKSPSFQSLTDTRVNIITNKQKNRMIISRKHRTSSRLRFTRLPSTAGEEHASLLESDSSWSPVNTLTRESLERNQRDVFYPATLRLANRVKQTRVRRKES